MSRPDDASDIAESLARRAMHYVRAVGASRSSATGCILMAVIVAAVLLASVLSPHDPVEQFSGMPLASPSGEHPLGADDLGRDLWARLLHGGRASLRVALAAVALGGTIGTTVGLVATYRGGWSDRITMRALDAFLALPAVILALFIVTVLGPSEINTTLAIGCILIPQFARIVRADVLRVKEQEYIAAVRCLGAPSWRIVLRHVLPNCVTSLTVQASLAIGYAILIEASLSFLGLGVQPPQPSWGGMLNSARGVLTITPWPSIYPGLAIFLTVLAANLIGDGLRTALDPRLRVGSG